MEINLAGKNPARGHLPCESYRKSEEALCDPDCGRLETLFRMSWRWSYLNASQETNLLNVLVSQTKCGEM